MHRHKHKVKYLIISIWVILLLFSGYVMFKNELSLSELANILQSYFVQIQTSQWKPLLPLAFVLIFIIRPLFLIPTWIMNVVAYVFFGFWWGFFWVILAEQISASLFYFFVKYIGEDMFKVKILRVAHKLRLDIDSSLEKEFYTVLALRFASLPFDFVTAFCALIGIPYLQFILGTLVVSLPWVGLFFLTFNSFSSRSLASGILHGCIFVFFIVISYLVARKSGIIRKSGVLTHNHSSLNIEKHESKI
jgi:uncharacterized membrane protein YdjX (TVP38/TMEM64 family)